MEKQCFTVKNYKVWLVSGELLTANSGFSVVPHLNAAAYLALCFQLRLSLSVLSTLCRYVFVFWKAPEANRPRGGRIRQIPEIPGGRRWIIADRPCGMMGVSRGPPPSKTPQVERYCAASSTSSASIGQSHPSSDTCWIFCWTCDFQAGFPNNCFLFFFVFATVIFLSLWVSRNVDGLHRGAFVFSDVQQQQGSKIAQWM